MSNANPRLDPHGLQSNGGPTQTVAILFASPAVDAIPPGTLGCGTDVTADQRGTHRPQGPRCDSGAFELAQTPGQIVVDTTADEQQPNGLCSLREAIVNANQNSQAGSPDCAAGIGNDTIVFELGAPSATITLSPQRGALPTASDPRGLTVDGGSASAVTVSGGNAVRIFEVDTGDQLALANLTLANGNPGPNGFFGGGGVLNLGGTLAVRDSSFTGNASGGAGVGGAISSISGGTLTVARSTFNGNTTPDSNPSGASAGGGAIANAGDATVTDSTFSGNHSGSGGALQNTVTLRVSGSTFTDNTSGRLSGGGGAIQSDSSLTVTNSTFVANKAAGGGGGIDNAATATIAYSTFTGNEPGGAIFAEATFEQETMLQGTILTSSIPDDNCAGEVIDQGFNIEDGDTCGFSPPSRPGTDPLLDPAGLKDNGGPTQTVGLQPQSPAIDAIPVGAIGCGTTVATDQRGVTRPQGPQCDSGAFERNSGLGSGPGHGKKPKKPKKTKKPKHAPPATNARA